jgi:alkaline phosphatase D
MFIQSNVFRVCSLVLMIAFTMVGCVGDAAISHGPMLGRLTTSSIKVWARTERPGSFCVAYGTSPNELTQKSTDVTTTLSHDNTGVVTLSGLTPETRYYYVTYADGKKGKGGSFRTLPDSSALVDAKLNPRGLYNFSFEYACGNNQGPEHGLGPSLPTYDTLLAKVKDKVDFAILNGDWLYEEKRDYSPSQWRNQVGASESQTPLIVKKAPNITGVWENYKLYMDRGVNLAEWHRSVPSYFTFDDHEIINDVFATAEVGYRSRRTVFRDIATRGWYDYLGWANPTRHKQGIHFGQAQLRSGDNVLVDETADFTKFDFNQAATLHVHWGTPDAGVMNLPGGKKDDFEGGDPNSRVYKVVKVIDKHRLEISPAPTHTGKSAYSIGRRSYGKFTVGNCDFFLLDTRSHRHLHRLKKREEPGRSMIGDHQREWLMAEAKKSKADFIFVVSTVNFMVPHMGAGGGKQMDADLKDDAWTAFLHERENLIEFFDALNKPVFVLTGDLHNSMAIKVTDRVWEFASGPHNSVNHRFQDEANRPINGPFKFGPRECEIKWSTTALADIPRSDRHFPHYCVVKVVNTYNNPVKFGGKRAVAYVKPFVMFNYHNGLTGELEYSQAVHATGQ